MKRLIILPALLYAGMMVYSQSVSYAYDNSGNRIERTLTLKSTASPGKQESAPEVFSDALGKLEIKIYPNPVRSELTVQITGQDENTDALIMLFDQGGRLVLHEDDISGTSILSLSGLMPGNYFMIIQSGNNTTRWKIVKE